MKKLDKKETEGFKPYKLDTAKPIAAEEYNSLTPTLLLLLALFFCIIFVSIFIPNKVNGLTDGKDRDYIIIGVVLGILLLTSIAIFVGYRIRNSLIRKEILASTVTLATVTDVTVTQSTTRKNDGSTRTKETVSLQYEFFDEYNNIRTGNYYKTYGSAPQFYKGQHIVIAFNEEKNYILCKYTLLDGDIQAYLISDNSDNETLTGESVNIDANKYFPLGYDIKYYFLALIYFVFALVFAALLTYYAVTVKDGYVWAYVGVFGTLLAVFTVLASVSFLIPFRLKRKSDSVLSVGATYTRGILQTENKIYRNGIKNKYICVYADTDGNKRVLEVSSTPSIQRYMRHGSIDAVVAYTQDKAVVLVESRERIL